MLVNQPSAPEGDPSWGAHKVSPNPARRHLLKGCIPFRPLPCHAVTSTTPAGRAHLRPGSALSASRSRLPINRIQKEDAWLRGVPLHLP